MDRIRKTDKIFSDIVSLLPTEPSREHLWTDGDEIYSADEREIETLANLFDELYAEGTTRTGYYDAKEDERSDETDFRSGYYYVANY